MLVHLEIKDAVIAASWLEATHLIIDSVIEMMTDELTVYLSNLKWNVLIYIQMVLSHIDRLQELRLLRPNLSTFKGGS